MVNEIAFIGYGEAARAFRESLAAHRNGLAFRAYDRKLDAGERPESAAEMAAAMVRDGVRLCETPGDLAGAPWIVSAVTAAQSLEAAKAAVAAVGGGTVFVDINSVSPERKRATEAAVAAAGGLYLDMAVMAPVHPRGHRTPVLVAGPALAAALPELAALDFDFAVAGEATGTAAAIKMIRSQFVKGLEAITVETLLAAEAAGVFEAILQSLSDSFAGLGWPEHAGYQLERTLRHGQRRAEEMEESAATVEALGLNGGLGREVAAIQAAMGRAGIGCLQDRPLREALAAVLAARRQPKAGEG